LYNETYAFPWSKARADEMMCKAVGREIELVIGNPLITVYGSYSGRICIYDALESLVDGIVRNGRSGSATELRD
jgi:hypothetical protein